ncbi:class I SAM-dependent methyltransferase [Kribbella italica]|uniref:class I SAM-dependent methyltransferase n=1 Tax=Kribbella italica TaxID=1540520 RepID=UPI003B58643C
MGEGDGVVGGVVGILRGVGWRPRGVLDLGCGTGRHLAGLVAEFGVDAVGVDLQEQLVEYGRQRYGVDVRVGDMRSVRLGRRSMWSPVWGTALRTCRVRMRWRPRLLRLLRTPARGRWWSFRR